MKWLITAVWAAWLPLVACAQEWSGPVRGSWVQNGPASAEDVRLTGRSNSCEIVVAPDEHSAVRQAARFLAADIGKISGFTPAIVSQPSGTNTPVHLVTLSEAAMVPSAINRAQLVGQWEAYEILATSNAVWLVGSNFRGTAFAAYTLSERLGIDPLYHWTGYQPEKHSELVLKKTRFASGPPTFKYRGFFHDDEDILPRPLEANGYPDGELGSVPQEWYERFFETALRLRMNQVAPYTRVRRRFEVQKTASDWGLFYSSHHYDILLSNPWGFHRHGLAKTRDAGGKWDWYSNREGMLRFWRAGVEENKELDCIWPVGLRDNDDKNYPFPEGTPMAEKRRVFGEVIAAQVEMTKTMLPADKMPLFHLTMYNASLDIFKSGPIPLPPEVIQVWNDDGIGHMRALPTPEMSGRRHGVYYHLAYVAWPLGDTVQNAHVVSPMTVAAQFKDIVQSGATEYMLLNVSELREFVMEARMIAEICWDAPAVYRQPDPAERYLRWWAEEYFGAAAANEVVHAYQQYYPLLPTPQQTWWDSDRVKEALALLERRFRNEEVIAPDHLKGDLKQRLKAYEAAMQTIARADKKMPADRRQYFYEQVEFPLLLGFRQLKAAALLTQAAETSRMKKRQQLCFAALDELQQLNADITRAERPPFELWYRNSWIRRKEHECELYRSYRNVAAFCARQFEDRLFKKQVILATEPGQTFTASQAFAGQAAASVVLPGETLKLTVDFRLHQAAFRSEPLFRLGVREAANGGSTRTAARVAFNSWDQGSLDAWATMELAGINRAASSSMKELGWNTKAKPMDQDSDHLRLIFTLTKLKEPGQWETRCTVLNLDTGFVMNSMPETLADRTTYETQQLWPYLEILNPQTGTTLSLDKFSFEKLSRPNNVPLP